jgi:hypothetical protein
MRIGKLVGLELYEQDDLQWLRRMDVTESRRRLATCLGLDAW